MTLYNVCWIIIAQLLGAMWLFISINFYIKDIKCNCWFYFGFIKFDSTYWLKRIIKQLLLAFLSSLWKTFINKLTLPTFCVIQPPFSRSSKRKHTKSNHLHIFLWILPWFLLFTATAAIVGLVLHLLAIPHFYWKYSFSYLKYPDS